MKFSLEAVAKAEPPTALLFGIKKGSRTCPNPLTKLDPPPAHVSPIHATGKTEGDEEVAADSRPCLVLGDVGFEGRSIVLQQAPLSARQWSVPPESAVGWVFRWFFSTEVCFFKQGVEHLRTALRTWNSLILANVLECLRGSVLKHPKSSVRSFASSAALQSIDQIPYCSCLAQKSVVALLCFGPSTDLCLNPSTVSMKTVSHRLGWHRLSPLRAGREAQAASPLRGQTPERCGSKVSHRS